ncbi:MAG: Ig domain-containing protein, partial [Acidobacteriota bacterium]|nr:Ig domain-containing protein [Acidobacteriota bacterium]
YPANLLTTTTNNFLTVINQRKIKEESMQPRVYYRIIAVDIEGNRSCPSECIEIPHPFIYILPPAVTKKGLVYNYQVHVTRAGPEIQYWGGPKKSMEYHIDVLSFKLVKGPEWLSIDSERGLLSGVVPSDAATEYTLVLKVTAVRKSDPKKVIGEDKQEFRLTIR